MKRLSIKAFWYQKQCWAPKSLALSLPCPMCVRTHISMHCSQIPSRIPQEGSSVCTGRGRVNVGEKPASLLDHKPSPTRWSSNDLSVLLSCTLISYSRNFLCNLDLPKISRGGEKKYTPKNTWHSVEVYFLKASAIRAVKMILQPTPFLSPEALPNPINSRKNWVFTTMTS